MAYILNMSLTLNKTNGENIAKEKSKRLQFWGGKGGGGGCGKEDFVCCTCFVVYDVCK